MSFLSIAFLTALPLAAAPVLLHLFDRRRSVVIEWGAMQFLMEAATRRTSARKLKQWLLLVMRVLAVAALVLALARPMLPGSWFGNTERGETILVLDNSMSMMRSTEDGPLFDKAVERAVTEVRDVEPGDFVRVLLASPYPVWATAGSIRAEPGSRQMLEERLKKLEPTRGRSDLLAALFTAVQAERQPTQKRRRLVLLTDGQASDWRLDDEGWKRFREVLQSTEMPTDLDIVELDRPAQRGSNLAVNAIHCRRTVVGADQTFTLTAHVQNHGRATAPSCNLTWSIGNDELYESRVPSLEKGEVHDVTWKHSIAETGVHAISCRIAADDELAPDNQATAVIEVVDRVPVLLVESAPELAEMQQDAFFVQAALGWIDGEPLNERSVYVPTLVEPRRLPQLNLKDYRAVVVANLKDLGQESVGRLQDFVLDGGGLWIALGPRTDVDTFNQFFFADGNGLAPLKIDRLVDQETARGTADDVPGQTTIDPFVKDHPATAKLSDNERLDLGDVAVSRRFRFVPPPQDDDVSVLLSLTNGQPLAVEKYVGRGRVIVQAIPLRLQWSDLARSQSFVVMVQDWLDYLTQPRATRHNLDPGDPISLRVANAELRDAVLKTPHGDQIELTAEVTGDEVVFRSSRTILPGDYSLEVGLSGDKVPFHVNRHPRESNLTPLTKADHELLAGIAGLSRSQNTATLSATNQSEPLWPTLLMILIGLIAGELFLSGLIARERFGAAPISETVEEIGGGTEMGRRGAGEIGRSIREVTRSTSREREPQTTDSVSERS